jgi:hypothetical protein
MEVIIFIGVQASLEGDRRAAPLAGIQPGQAARFLQ